MQGVSALLFYRKLLDELPRSQHHVTPIEEATLLVMLSALFISLMTMV